MMRRLIRLSLTALLGVAGLFANVVTVDIAQSNGSVSMSLDPSGGILYGNVGDTVGWGFNLSTDANYGVAVVSSDFCNNSSPPFSSPCTAFYTDYIGAVNSTFIDFSSPPVTQSFDETNQLGYGAFVVQSAPVTGYLVLQYYLYDTNYNQVTPNLYVSAFAEVSPQIASTPEPALAPAAALILAGLLGLRRRRKLHRRPAPLTP
jgi:MYXO-CTERM domain-containing protein